MKSQAECWAAVINGKQLIDKRKDIVWLSEDGRARTEGKGPAWYFIDPDDWEIYEEPILYYRWKKITKNGRVYMSAWYPEDKEPVETKWVRIEPGKTFEEIGQ